MSINMYCYYNYDKDKLMSETKSLRPIKEESFYFVVFPDGNFAEIPHNKEDLLGCIMDYCSVKNKTIEEILESIYIFDRKPLQPEISVKYELGFRD